MSKLLSSHKHFVATTIAGCGQTPTVLVVVRKNEND
jgi:hypothetical protein